MEAIETLPQLKPFVEQLHKREKVFLRNARKQTRESQPFELSRRIKKIHAGLEKYSYEEFNARLLSAVDQTF